MSRARWRERIESGLYRGHLTKCPRSSDRRPGGRCSCPFEIKAPGAAPGTTKTVTVRGSIGQARAERRRLMAEGRPPAVDPLVAAETLDDFTRSYFASKEHVLAQNTLAGYETEYRLRVSPVLGHLRLAELTRERVEKWKAVLIDETFRAGRSRRMVVQSVAVLSTILSEAVRWERLSANPARGLDLPPAETHEAGGAERTLNEAQLVALLTKGSRSTRRNGAESTRLLRIETIVRAAAEAGLRRGEIAALRWSDIDLEARRITVRRSAWEAGGRSGVKATKGRRARSIRISEAFAEALGAWEVEAVVEQGNPADGWVWPANSGDRMRTRSVWQAIARAMVRAGLVDSEGRPLVSAHGLRHTCGSLLLASGVPLIVVSRHLGHRDTKITADVYAHLVDADAQLDAVARAFDVFHTTQTVAETVADAEGSLEIPVDRDISAPQ